MGRHVAQMTGRDAMGWCFGAVTQRAAGILGLEGYGSEPGCWADMVVLQASDPIEAIRLKAARLFVIRRGKVIASTPKRETALFLEGRLARLDPADYAPREAGG